MPHLLQTYWPSSLQSNRREAIACHTCQAQNGNHMIADVGRTTTAIATSVT